MSREVPPKAQAPTPTATATVADARSAFVGSKTCRDCHESFYHLWATSRHGLAMQPYTPAFAAKELTPQKDTVAIGPRTYRAEVGPGVGGVVREKGPQGEKSYPIAHVMGGKNAYYFLTPLERGRLQVLPVAYDTMKKTWYDTAASGVRHFPDRPADQALDWTDRMFTFNTTCFNCHVSQLATNYDLSSDTYHTTWAEPGISCESCHGPARDHVRTMEEGEPKGHTSADIKIIRTREFGAAQMNDMCATCHAKMVPMSTSFTPGDRFFDHFDLITLEHPDFYPDGRDLGENYTFTSWLQSPCVKASESTFDCNHCHTASGRPKYEGKEADRSCLPCHQKTVDSAAAHGHHAPGSAGNRCVSCHMPTTRFAAMGRTDHSMRSPTPATTREFQSPNACNLCHADKTPAWADEWVRKWYPRDYQAPVLRQARLLDDARKDRWQDLPAMLARLSDGATDSVWKASLVRLLRDASGPSKVPALRARLTDGSALVRSAAATALGETLDDQTIPPLLAATRDPSRLVRIRAAQSLAAVPPEMIPAGDRPGLTAAVNEFRTAMTARPDDWASHANLGNFHMSRGAFEEAVREFETATRLEPRVVGPMVNAAIAYSNLGQDGPAEAALRKAQAIEPANASVNFNLGLLLGGHDRLGEAETALRAALKADPRMAPAAFNLGVILARTKDAAAAVPWCRQAHEIAPDDPKYVHALAFYQRQGGDRAGAVATLKPWLEKHPLDAEASLQLSEVYVEKGDRTAAAGLLRDTLTRPGLPEPQRAALARALQSLDAPARP